MQSRKDRWQEDLFVASPLRDLVPEDHILKRVDRVLDLSWLHDAVSECYCQDNGRPSIDPESALRLMLAGFFEGIVQDRRLMRRAQTDLAFRWFAGYRLDEPLPDRSSLTRIRQRWGSKRFQEVFERTVKQCLKAGLVNADTVHVDATLIRADVSWDSITTRYVDEVIDANQEEDDPPDDETPPTPPAAGRPRTWAPKPKKFSPTDPDATMATSCQQFHLEPSYKQHTAVEDSNGIIVDVEVTTGEASEGKYLLEQLDRVEMTTERTVKTVTCDAGYAHGSNYAALEARNTDAIIPPQKVSRRKKGGQQGVWGHQSSRSSGLSGSNTTSAMTASNAPPARCFIEPRRSRLTTPPSTGPAPATAEAARCVRAASRPQTKSAPSGSAKDSPRCSGREDARNKAGMEPLEKPITATDGAWKACMAEPRPAMD